MRLCELEDKDVFLKKIVNDCMPYLSAIDFDSSKFAIRDGGLLHTDEINFYNTRVERNSVAVDKPLQLLVADYMSKNKIPSRYNHVVFASSRGLNTAFGIDFDQSGYIIPKGEFSFAYVEDDFNDNDILRDLNIMLYRIEQLISVSYFNSIIEESTIDDVYENLKTAAEPFLDEDDSKSLKALDFIRDNTSTLTAHLDAIQTSNLEKAFDAEHEIWFNCKGYYYIPYTDDDESVSLLKKYASMLRKPLIPSRICSIMILLKRRRPNDYDSY